MTSAPATYEELATEIAHWVWEAEKRLADEPAALMLVWKALKIAFQVPANAVPSSVSEQIGREVLTIAEHLAGILNTAWSDTPDRVSELWNMVEANFNRPLLSRE